MSEKEYKPNWVFFKPSLDGIRDSIEFVYDAASEISPIPIKVAIRTVQFASNPKKYTKKILKKTPICKEIYDEGKFDGKKEGYEKASFEYEEKLIKLADDFLSQRKDFANEKAEYEELIDKYEKYLQENMQKNNLSEKETYYTNRIKELEIRLKDLKEEL